MRAEPPAPASAPSALPRSGAPGSGGAECAVPVAEACAIAALTASVASTTRPKPAGVAGAEAAFAVCTWPAGVTRSAARAELAADRWEDAAVAESSAAFVTAATCGAAGGAVDPAACVDVGWAVCLDTCVGGAAVVAEATACFALEAVAATGAVTGAAAFVTGATAVVTGAAAFVAG